MILTISLYKGGIDLLVDAAIVKKFAKLSLELSKQTAIKAHKYLEEHEHIKGYYKYPIQDSIFSRDNPEFAELFEKIPYLTYDIPKYKMNDFPKESILYSAIFRGYANDCLDCTTLDEFNALVEYIDSTPELRKLITDKDDLESLKYRIKYINTEIVERYLYVTNSSCNIPSDLEEQLKPFVSEKLLRYLAKELQIDILIPICLATFEDDNIKLSETIEIVRMTDEIQKSRQQACPYEVSKEDWVAACATHMIVLHNYHFKNTGDISINSATQNYNAYPLQVIDNIMAAIRIVTGYTIGYEQILSCPIKWIDSFCADLVPLYGAKAHFTNPKEIEKFWIDLPVSRVSSEQSKKLQSVYQNILKFEKDVKKSNLIFALNRFNRCMLRNEVDDMATDATIGIEALIAGGTKGEITYTISNRIPVVFAHEHNELYTPTNCRSIMKTIYNYRSKIVHGGKLKDKDKYFEINGKKFDVSKIAVDFLRYSLLFVLEHQEFLDAKKFDEYIDSIMSNKFQTAPIQE